MIRRNLLAVDRGSPLFRFNRDRNAVIDEVVERVTREALDRAWKNPSEGLEYLLNEAAYVEIERLDGRTDQDAKEERSMWTRIARSMGRSTEEENAERLRNIVAKLAGSTVGHFRPTVFRFATEVLPSGISYALSRGVRPDGSTFAALRDRLVIEGEVGKLRRLSELGTIVYVPTHSSHLDSVLVAWAMHEARLPAVVYGADANLFTHPLMAFFMANLGAYKVNRERGYRLYRRVLKAYSQVLLEFGYHSMFFPAGKRSRLGTVEDELKLGLLSTSLEAYTENILRGRLDRPIYIVPITVNYQLVLEAATLIDDGLAKPGASRPIIKNDEFTDVRRVAAYVRSSLDLGLTTTIRFCTPMDVFGNPIDQDGESIDLEGRRVDPQRYLWVDGEARADQVRDREYTRLLAGRLVEAYRRNVVIHPLHLVSFALVEHLRRAHPDWDVNRTLRFSKGDGVSEAVAIGETERLIRLARRDASQSRYRLSRAAKTQSAAEMIDDVLAIYARASSAPALVRQGRRLKFQGTKLLYFYSNRLRGYGLERRLGAAPGGY